MLQTFDLHGEPVDSLDLKCLLLGMGMKYPTRVYGAIAGRARLAPPHNPYACNCIILPGQVAVHLMPNDASPFALDLDDAGDDTGRIALFHDGERLTEVSFPPPTDYYRQCTSAARPFGSYAVLEGVGLLAFFYMWPCEYVRTKETCEFCFQVRADMAGYELPSPTDEEVAEIIGWAIDEANVREVQLTAGTKFIGRDECGRYARLLEVIDRRVGLDRIKSEIYCYMTAPKEPTLVDQVFAAGADRVAHDLHVWDRRFTPRLRPATPGTSAATGSCGHLSTLRRSSARTARSCAFVAGIEPLDSMLAGAEYLASRGIVPALSVWMPPPGSTTAGHRPPGLDYYRQARREFARLYREHRLNPPGIPAGSHVSICRDVWRHDL